MKCPVCNKENNKEFFSYKDITFLYCEQCEAIYRKDYQRINVSDLIEKVYDSKWINMRNSLVNTTFLGYSFFYNTLLNFIPEKKGKLLEIGCGTGELLYLAKSYGWKVKGIEPSKDSYNHIKKVFKDIEVINDIWKKELLNKNEKFDVIIFVHLLEHIRNPKEFLNEVKEFLKDDGLIILGMPNGTIIDRKLNNKIKRTLIVEDHIVLYGKNTIEKLAELCNLKIRNLICHNSLEVFKVNNHLSFEDTLNKINELIKDEITFRGNDLVVILKKNKL